MRPRRKVAVTGSIDCSEAPIQAVVEIAADLDGRLPDVLLAGAYEASSRGLVVLSFTGVTWEAVNEILDRVVPRFPIDIPGVRYIDTFDRSSLESALCGCNVVFGDTEVFRNSVTALLPDIRVQSSDEFERVGIRENRRGGIVSGVNRNAGYMGTRREFAEN